MRRDRARHRHGDRNHRDVTASVAALRRAAFTVFDQGHSYADGVFFTCTTIIGTIGGTVIGDLESWRATRDGKAFANRDVNFRQTPDGNIVWRLRADVDEPPRPFVRAGFSPAVVR